MTLDPQPNPPAETASEAPPRRRGFGADFQRYFMRGLGTLLPTLITIALIWYVVNFLWNSVGWYVIEVIKRLWLLAERQGLVEPTNQQYISWFWAPDRWYTQPLGVLAALILIYLIGLLVGNFIGRAFYRLAERLVLSVPFVRAVYPAVKQVVDFLVGGGESQKQFEGSRVVAVQPHAGGIWSIALVTAGEGVASLAKATGQEMVTVFVPSSPTAFSGYVMVVPRDSVVELPMSVEEAMRLFVSGGVVGADQTQTKPRKFGRRDTDKIADEMDGTAGPAPARMPRPVVGRN